MNSLKYELQPSRLDQGAQGRGGWGDVGGSSSAIGYKEVYRRVYFDRFVNKTARPYILFMSKAID